MKKSLWKRMLSLLLSMVVICCTFAGIEIPVSAASTGYSFGSAIALQEGQTYTKSWTTYNDSKGCYISFTMAQTGLFQFEMTKPIDAEGEYGEVTFYVYDTNGAQITKFSTGYSGNKVKDYHELKIGLPAGSYYLYIDPDFIMEAGNIPSVLSYTTKASKYYEQEPNEAGSTATKVTLGKEYTGYFGSSGDEEDWYCFDLEQGQTYYIVSKDLKANFNPTTAISNLYDVSGSKVDSVLYYMQYDSVIGADVYCFTAKYTGTYTLQIYNYHGNNGVKEYTFKVIPQPDTPPELVSVENTDSGIAINWNKLPYASEYIVYRKTSDSSWKKLGTVGKSETSYVDKTAKSGTKYTYTVKATVNGITTKYDETGLTITCLATPKISSIKNAASGISIKWAEVKGAKKYTVYRKTDTAKYFTEVGSTTKTSFVDKTAKSGVTYTYVVEVYNKGYISASSAESTMMRLATPTVSKVTASTGKVTVTFGEVTGATSYTVYRKTAKGSWKAVGSTTSTKYVDKTAKKGTTYYYAVRAKSDGYNGAYDSTGYKVTAK